jgi:hypothetical protein
MSTKALLERQLAELAAVYPGAALTLQHDGSHVASAPVATGEGWSRPQVVVEFVVPLPYPSAQPDSFFTDADLRLAGGAMPTNTGMQALGGQPRLWFSWHLQSAWLPTRHTLLTYVRFIEERFRRAH